MQERPLFVTVLAIVMGLAGLFIMATLVVSLAFGFPSRAEVMGRPLSKIVAYEAGIVVVFLLLICAYGLWRQKWWGAQTTALIIALDVIEQAKGKHMLTFFFNSIDFGMLLEIVLLVAVLSLPGVTLHKSASNEEQTRTTPRQES